MLQDPQDTEAPEPAPSAAAAPSGLGLLSRPGSGTGMGGGAGAFANLMRLGSSFREAPATGRHTHLWNARSILQVYL